MSLASSPTTTAATNGVAGGSFFQDVAALAYTTADSSWLEVDGRRAVLWRDFYPSHDPSLHRDPWAGGLSIPPVDVVRPLVHEVPVFAGVARSSSARSPGPG